MSKKKQKKGRSSGLPRGVRRNLGWIITGGLAFAVSVAVLVAVLSGGSSSDGIDRGSGRTPEPDPRLAGASPVATANVEADDEGQQVNPRFVPNVLEGPAGEVFAIDIKNVGTVAHDLRVSGADKQFETTDDFTSAVVESGEEVELLVKIDAPGSYPFRCNLHPGQQVGTLVLD